MSKIALIRAVALPLAFVAIVIALIITPTNTRFVSFEDILYIETQSGEIRTPEGREAFVNWLGGIVPKDEMCFVKESKDYEAESGDIYATAYQTPDKMEGIDSGETFTYSIYRMYIRFTDGKMYYNGVEYDVTDKEIADFESLAQKYGGK